jgi:hypothetical protein
MDLTQNLVTFDEVERLKLAEILRDKTFVSACNYIIRKQQPNLNDATNLTPEARAAKFSQLGGMTLMLHRLDQLSKPQTNAGEVLQDIDGWGHE